MKKFNWDEPITWRKYAKLTIICMVISFIIGIIQIACMFPATIEEGWNWIQRKFWGLVNKIKGIFKR